MTGERSLFEELEVARRGKKAVVRPKRTPSSYQQAILDAVRAGGRNIRVNATAGSGKTSLLEMIAEQLPTLNNEKAGFLAHNQHIVKELRNVIPNWFDVRTVNSLGHAICLANCPQAKFEPRKYDDLMRELISQAGIASPAARRELLERLQATVQLHVGHAFDLDMPLETWLDAMLELDAPVEGAESTIHSLTRRTLKQGLVMLRDQGVLSFIDQVMAPSIFHWTLPQPYRYLLVDEVQDLSKAQMQLLIAATSTQSLVVGVGDKSQSIYSFAGADQSSMARFTQVFNALELPLSMTYRCPKRHVALAQFYTDSIEAAPDAKEGTLADLSLDEFERLARVGDLGLCRTNAPLVQQFYALIAAGVPAMVRGRDVCRSLVALARDVATWDCKNKKVNRALLKDDLPMDDFPDKLMDFIETQQEKLLQSAEREGRDVEGRIATLLDKYLALTLVMDQGKASTVGNFTADIRRLFDGKPEESVVLSTIHRAKGLEADTVFILEPDLLPFPKAKTPQALESERCLEFVAYTRAKKALYFVAPQNSKIPIELQGISS